MVGSKLATYLAIATAIQSADRRQVPSAQATATKRDGFCEKNHKFIPDLVDGLLAVD
jgi:folate-dependent tRNA-U54 methylase TrmFO/GidA